MWTDMKIGESNGRKEKKDWSAEEAGVKIETELRKREGDNMIQEQVNKRNMRRRV
jgi:hypothetical protein